MKTLFSLFFAAPALTLLAQSPTTTIFTPEQAAAIETWMQVNPYFIYYNDCAGGKAKLCQFSSVNIGGDFKEKKIELSAASSWVLPKSALDGKSPVEFSEDTDSEEIEFSLENIYVHVGNGKMIPLGTAMKLPMRGKPCQAELFLPNPERIEGGSLQYDYDPFFKMSQNAPKNIVDYYMLLRLKDWDLSIESPEGSIEYNAEALPAELKISSNGKDMPVSFEANSALSYQNGEDGMAMRLFKGSKGQPILVVLVYGKYAYNQVWVLEAKGGAFFPQVVGTEVLDKAQDCSFYMKKEDCPVGFSTMTIKPELRADGLFVKIDTEAYKTECAENAESASCIILKALKTPERLFGWDATRNNFKF